MQNFLFLGAALCAGVAKAGDLGPTINEAHRAKFITHVEKHNLRYVGQEFDERLAIFSANLVSIELHNSAPAGTHTYTQGITPFTHLTSEEFAEFVTRGRNKKTKTADEQAFHDSMPVFDGSVSDSIFGISARHLGDELGATETIDWRTVPGVLTPVKNQNACGSCWTFGASGAMEGAYALRSSATAPTETLFSGLTYNAKTSFFGISEQQFIDCDNQMSYGCEGGEPNSAFVWAAKNGGVTSERVYPYTSGNYSSGQPPVGNCQTAKIAQKLDGTALRTDYPYTNVVPYNITALEAAVRQQPVQIVVQGGPSFPGAPSPLQNYNGGIITLASGCAQNLDHSVLLVGYHSDTVDASQNYWIVKNSWSDQWGVKGYYYVAKSQENACGILMKPSFPNLAAPGQVPFTQPPVPAPVPAPWPEQDNVHFQTVENQYIGTTSIDGYSPIDISPAQFVKLGNTPPYKIQQILPVEATLDIRLDGYSPQTQTCTPYIYRVYDEIDTPHPFLEFVCAAYGSTSATETYTFVARVICFIGPTKNNTDVLFALKTVNKIDYDLPLTYNNVLEYAMVNSTSSYVQRVTNDQNKGVGVKNIKFVLMNDYPTASPTITPIPTLPPPTGNFISGSLITSVYAESLDCTGALVSDKVQSYGLCYYDPQNKKWTKTTPGNPSVTSPTDPYSLPLVFRLYTDETCTTLEDSESSGIMVNKCVANPPIGSSEKITFVRNLDDAPTKNIAGLAAGGGVVWSYNSAAACQTADMAQALMGYSTKIGGCTSVPNNNPALEFHSWNAACSGTGFQATVYPDDKCAGTAKPIDFFPYTSPASVCMYSSALKMYSRTSCAASGSATPPAAPTASTDSTNFKGTAVGVGIVAGALFIGLIITLYLYRKVSTELAIARGAKANSGNEMINSMYEGKSKSTNNPITGTV